MDQIQIKRAIPKIKILNYTFPTLLLALFLPTSFFCLFASFQYVDYYHTEFFNSGSPVIIYNISRLLFLPYIIWIIYVSGFALVNRLVPSLSLPSYTQTERLIIGFSVGLGVWHLTMLVLGYFNLYYQHYIVGLCLLILGISAVHFKRFANESLQVTKNAFRKPLSIYSILTVVTVLLFLAWLLLVRSIYPGGSGDYFTHYFYYNLSVIHHHGLAPNDVWYHYFYSKGTGLQFLGMILMDPLAPSLITFCYVAIASIALVNLIAKLSPKSFWPAFVAIIYIVYNLTSPTGEGGEFEKTHELTTALIIFSIWAVSMYELQPAKWIKISFIMLASIVVAGAIITQATIILLSIFFAFQCGLALFYRRWQKFRFYLLLSIISAIAVLSIFLLNYFTTGLLTDQSLDLSWKLANVERLNQWGILPNLIMIMWERDNYDMVAVPWQFGSVGWQLIKFLRLDIFKLLIEMTASGIVIYLISMIIKFKKILFILKTQLHNHKSSNEILQKFFNFKIDPSLLVLINITKMIAIFALLSVFIGHAQDSSYLRFSSFFLPLTVLFITIIWVLITKNVKYCGILLPIICLYITVSHWDFFTSKISEADSNVVKFLKGKYSLGMAYQHLSYGASFGGINPGVYEAFKHVPKGSRIWSTNIDSYCTVPDCIIESVFSFKLSSHLNEILSGTPIQAKKLLQQENLNYFILSDQSKLYDILPHSYLFAPKNISKYLGIEWTDGSTYLLTWSEYAHTPIDAHFLKLYKGLLDSSEHPWFRFKELVPAMNVTMKNLYNSPHPWKPFALQWRNSPVNTQIIRVIHASYGLNCRLTTKPPFLHLISARNATTLVKYYCINKNKCSFTVNTDEFGDPAVGCDKILKISYRCGSEILVHKMLVAAPALDKTINISCMSISNKLKLGKL
jgi:hypothetical protein